MLGYLSAILGKLRCNAPLLLLLLLLLETTRLSFASISVNLPPRFSPRPSSSIARLIPVVSAAFLRGFVFHLLCSRDPPLLLLLLRLRLRCLFLPLATQVILRRLLSPEIDVKAAAATTAAEDATAASGPEDPDNALASGTPVAVEGERRVSKSDQVGGTLAPAATTISQE